MNIIGKIILPVILILQTTGIQAQLTAISPANEKTVLSAMNDEMQRNIAQLGGPEFVKPFFIAYTQVCGQTLRCTSKLGSLYEKKIRPVREGTIRLMVGSYELNDENFKGSESGYSDPSPLLQLSPLPIEDDYQAIRRYYWQMSDEVFRSANENYKHKQEAIKRKGGTYQPDGLKDFSPAPSVKKLDTPIVLPLNEDSISDLICRISKFFSGDTLYTDSEVSYSAGNYMTYYMNTESTELHFPYSNAEISIYASCFDTDGAMLNERLSFEGLSPDELPREEVLMDACRLIRERLMANRIPDTIPEDYNGPVMYEGITTANLFKQYYFYGPNTLIASREALKDENHRQTLRQDAMNDQKYNKRLFSKELTVVDCPAMKEFNGIKLYGHYTIDSEGITPPDSLLLVENGVLRNMLNDRIPTQGQPEPNGHSRFGGSSVSDQVVPSVLKVTTNNGKSKADLKKLLLEEAADRNLDYAIIVRPLFLDNYYCGEQYYRVNVADNSETLVREDVYNDSYDSDQALRILGTSSDLTVKNDFFNYGNDTPVSFIVPDAVVIESGSFSFSRGGGSEIQKRPVPHPLTDR